MKRASGVAGAALCAWALGAVLAGGTLLAGAAPAGSPVGAEPLQAIRTAAVAYVKSQLAASEVAHISAGALDARLRLARCAAPLDVEPIAGTAAMAQSTISVACTAPAHWKVFVPVSVVRQVPVLILEHAVARGSHLSASDVEAEVRQVSGFAAPFLGSAAQLAGRSTDRTLAAGTPLTVDMFELDPIVRRGQDVTLVVQADGFEVRAAGLALEDARPGARLNVENLSSRKVVQGVAESSGVVAVGD
jgi:flagellar basal body P-ring formation protein FlgA